MRYVILIFSVCLLSGCASLGSWWSAPNRSIAVDKGKPAAAPVKKNADDLPVVPPAPPPEVEPAQALVDPAQPSDDEICDHLAGEEAYDEERARYLEVQMAKYCHGQ